MTAFFRKEKKKNSDLICKISCLKKEVEKTLLK